MEIPIPKGNEARQAVDALGGYVYQIYQSALAWIELKPDEFLFLEVAEDYVVAANAALTGVQVKKTRHNVTINSDDIIASINSFVELRQENPELLVRFRHLTTSKIVKEQSSKHRIGNTPTLKMWKNLAKTGDVTRLRNILNESKLSEQTKNFIAELSDTEFREEFLKRIQFDCGAQNSKFLKRTLLSGLLKLLLERKGKYSQVDNCFNKIFIFLLIKATQKKDRYVDKIMLEKIICEVTEISVNLSQFEEQSQLINKFLSNTAQQTTYLVPKHLIEPNRNNEMPLADAIASRSLQIDNIVSSLTQHDYVVIGIDRNIKQLATLAVLDKEGKILGDFDIYKRTFNYITSQWEHECVEKRHILDLSNLRVEAKANGNKVLVDQSLTLVKEVRNTPGKYPVLVNRSTIKLKQLAYIRKLQYQMQTNEDAVLALIDDIDPDYIEFNIELETRIKNSKIISPYGEGKAYADLPITRMREMIFQLRDIINNGNDQHEKDKLIDLDATDDLKRGIVANMIGVVNFILAKYDYKAFVSIENLYRAWGGARDGLDGRYLPSTNQDPDMDFMQQQNQLLAGLGIYQIFEMQLLEMFSEVQKNRDISHYAPLFLSINGYKNIVKNLTAKKDAIYHSKAFGIVRFIDPRGTASRCPICGKSNINRNFKQANIVRCKEEKCGFISIWSEDQLESTNPDTERPLFTSEEFEFIKKNNERVTKKKSDKNLHYIHNGDDNGAYHIALKTVDNLLGKKS